MSTDQLHGLASRVPAILVVEDEPVLLHLTAENLKDRGYAVREAGTAVKAAEELRNAVIDVAFVDVNLPGLMGGLTFAVWLHAQYPNIPVILTSGMKSIPATLKGVGAVPFVQKPYDIEELTQLIEEALGRY
jgi:DNA-binding NtrC family response regulator